MRTRLVDPKELALRFIPTRFHAPLDDIVGAATAVSVVLGIGPSPTASSRTTSSASGRSRRWPCTTSSTSSPVPCWPSPRGSSATHESANFWAPFVVIGVAAIFLGLTTKQAGGYRYGTTRRTTATG